MTFRSDKFAGCRLSGFIPSSGLTVADTPLIIFFFMKQGTVIKSEMVWFHRADLHAHWPRISERLTSRSRYDEDEDGAQVISNWTVDGDAIGLPIHYGMIVADYLKSKVIDLTTVGEPASFPLRPTARNPKQESFFSTLLSSARDRDTVLAVAPTGTGKTIGGLYAIAELGRAAIVIVPSKNLAHQWKKEAMTHLGLTDQEVHVFEGGKCKWVGYKIVVAVIHNLCNRDWPNGFYNNFGTAVWDEAHRVGARVFSQSLQKFPAASRIALTATPDRKDGRTSILHQAFGEPDKSVKGNRMAAMPCSVYVVNTFSKVMGKSHGSTVMQMGGLISAIAADKARNELIADIVNRGRKAGRSILVIGDRIDQLKALKKDLAGKYGVDPKTMGLFIGSATKDQLEKIKAECQIIFATYGMMKEGQDVPRLDMGIDVTPRSDGVQAIGRIRRMHEGKAEPIWVTLFDSQGSRLLQGISSARIKDYKSCGATIENVGHKLNSIPF